MYVCMHVRIYVYIHIYIHTHTYTHTHIYIKKKSMLKNKLSMFCQRKLLIILFYFICNRKSKIYLSTFSKLIRLEVLNLDVQLFTNPI
jgi:hypothetical protein